MFLFSADKSSLRLFASSSAMAIAVMATPAMAQTRNFDVPAQSADKSIPLFAKQAGVQLVASGVAVRGKKTNAVRGNYTVDAALQALLRGTGLTTREGPKGSNFITVVSSASESSALDSPAQSTQGTLAARPQAYDDEIIVTAQRKEERITDVPIAMTALSANAMDDLKIEGGSELLRAVPNVSFSKTNFSMYNFSIRGIGTQSISASSDPAVAVSFNSTPLVRNRLFEAEFFDLERVEILRGPQGTLYGRNATAGVVNILPAMPTDEFNGALKAEVGNYETRRMSGMLNVPITDTLGVRVAGMMTKRDGYDYNTFFQTRINGRDLWSTRATMAWEPSDRFKANVIWQHFSEDDNRSRSSKQLCTPDPGPEKIGNVTITDDMTRARIGQGCLPGPLYDDAAFGTPTAAALVYLFHPSDSMSVGNSVNKIVLPFGTIIQIDKVFPVVKDRHSLDGVVQSKNLREVSSNYDPIFRANNDVIQFNMEFKPSENLQFISQTAYSRDRFYSIQDYNRFVTKPLFEDSSRPELYFGTVELDTNIYPGPTPGGIRCDYQLGCSDRMVSVDLSQSKNRQWSQEFRIQSSFDSELNFLAGANYLNFKSQDNYYVFNNMFTLIGEHFYSMIQPTASNPGITVYPCDLGDESRECINIETNSIDNIKNEGHNYFLSKNGVMVKSYGLFGEVYWDISGDLKLTIGGRYTKDKKRADQIPSQLLLGGGRNSQQVVDAGGPDSEDGSLLVGDWTGGSHNSGYPAQDDINLSWGRFTGRVVVDWKPDLKFTDDSLIYASASRGYKGGGVNPPRIDFNPAVVQFQFLPQTFRPEYVNAFEIGMKNSFSGGRFTLNTTAFLYDYKDFQVSQIVDRIAYNENFNATSWGLELEAAWRPTRAFRVDGNLGYLKTRLGKGSQSIDVMNRTQGNPDWVVLRPWLQVPSNCIAPRALVEAILAKSGGAGAIGALATLCPGADRVGSWQPDRDARGPDYWKSGSGANDYGFTYDPFAPYDPDKVGLLIAFDPANPDAWKGATSGAPNGGRGFYAELEGNELPNAPRLTMNIGAQYTVPLDRGDWELTFRGDYYRQSKSFGRVYNTKFDRIRGWDNVNMAVTLARPESDLTFQLYVKNVFKKMPITGFFVNSDDNGLTTNVFTPDPRIIGFSAAMKF